MVEFCLACLFSVRFLLWSPLSVSYRVFALFFQVSSTSTGSGSGWLDTSSTSSPELANAPSFSTSILPRTRSAESKRISYLVGSGLHAPTSGAATVTSSGNTSSNTSSNGSVTAREPPRGSVVVVAADPPQRSVSLGRMSLSPRESVSVRSPLASPTSLGSAVNGSHHHAPSNSGGVPSHVVDGDACCQCGRSFGFQGISWQLNKLFRNKHNCGRCSRPFCVKCGVVNHSSLVPCAVPGECFCRECDEARRRRAASASGGGGVFSGLGAS